MQVGSLSPGIEVWDLDVLDAVEPMITLGGELPSDSKSAQEQEAEEDASAKPKKQKKSKVASLAGHPALPPLLRPRSLSSEVTNSEKWGAQ